MKNDEIDTAVETLNNISNQLENLVGSKAIDTSSFSYVALIDVLRISDLLARELTESNRQVEVAREALLGLNEKMDEWLEIMDSINKQAGYHK